MIECSLFSIKKDVQKLRAYLESCRWRSRILKEKENIYVGSQSKIYFLESRSRIVQRSRYDYNKERKCVCCAVSESAVLECGDVDGMMCALGFRKEKTLCVDGLFYTHSGINLEIIRTCTAESGCSPGGGSFKGVQDEWLLVLYTTAETAAVGERLVLETRDRLRSYATFIKPSIEWFNQGFASGHVPSPTGV